MRPGDVWRRLREVLGAARLARDVDDELAAHVEHRVDDLVAAGMTPDEARTRARDEFGDADRIAAECRRVRERDRARRRVAGALDDLRRDVGQAVRQLARDPGFAAVAALTLMLGIGGTTAIVSVVQAVVFEPLPFEEPDRLVWVEEVTPTGNTFSVSHPTFLDWREQAGSFADLGALTYRSMTRTGDGDPEALQVGRASASLLPVLGVEPLLGRWIAPDEDRPGDPARVAVLGHELWRESFGGGSDVVGSTVVLDGQGYRVVGVLPPAVPMLDGPDLMLPLGASPTASRGDHDLDVVGRLAEGEDVAGAQARMETLAARLGDVHPEDAGWSVRVAPVRDLLVGDELTRAGWILLLAAGLLLVIACVNVSNVFLARASVRGREMGVRAALGAGRGRLTRQLLTESLVTAAVGGALGLALASLALPAVRALGGGTIPRLEAAALSPQAVAVCLLSVLLATLLAGMAPMLELRGPSPFGELRSGARGGTGPRRLRAALVAGQIALSLALLLGTGLLLRSFQRLSAVDPGFDTAGSLTARLYLGDQPDERRALLSEIVAAAEEVPGVTRAGATAVPPFGPFNLMNFVARQDRMPADARDFQPIGWRVITPGLLESMGVRLLEGRDFREGDGWDGASPVLVTESLARRLWPEGGAVGSTLVWNDPQGSRLTVIGVADDILDWRLGEPPQPMVLRAYADIPWAVMTLVVRGRGSPASLAEGIRDAVRRAAPGVGVPDVTPMSLHLDRAVAEPRFHAILLAAFALAGLLLALVGVYGVTAFDVSRRVREIGIRLALGGDPVGVRGLVVRDSLRLAVVGILAGAFLGWLMGRAMTSLLFRTEPLDPATWLAAPALLLAACAAAAWLPARRATRVQPTEALAGE